MKTRITAALAVTATAGLVLTGCFPPNENPSDIKVDTAVEQNPNSLAGGEKAANASPANTAAGTSGVRTVQFIDCVGEPAVQPESVSTNCSDFSAQITQINWEQWGRYTAQGTGMRPDGSAATVELSAPVDNGEFVLFTQVLVDGQPVA